MSDPKLAIIIATFNDARHLDLTLRSIADQKDVDPGDLEVVVVDGGSTDGTASLITAYEGVVTTYVSERDRGVYDAMNKGARLASSRWIHFLNAGDAFAVQNALAIILSAISRTKHSPWLIFRAMHQGGGLRAPVTIQNVPHVWWRHAFGLQPHCHQACLFDREVFTSVGGHDLEAGFAADFDYILRMGLLAPPEEVAEILVTYQGGGISHQRGREIPELLHTIRCKRLQLNSSLTTIDLVVTRVLEIYLVCRRLGGGALRKLPRARLGT